jgi:hypothetical protein
MRLRPFEAKKSLSLLILSVCEPDLSDYAIIFKIFI